MAITLKPINIIGLDIAGSVGRKGDNDPDDMFNVKTLLNGISTDAGGTDGTLDPKDASIAGASFDRLVEAIFIFQTIHFKGVFPADGLVEHGKKTIRKLQELHALQHGKDVKISLGVLPDGPLFGDANATGFSAARLTRPGPRQEWTSRNPLLPITQFVPVRGTRKLIVTKVGSAGQVNFKLSSGFAAEILTSDDKSVTLIGKLPGKVDLIVSIEGQSAQTVKIVVRASSSIAVNSIHLGPPQRAGDEKLFALDAIPAINRILTQQTNITLTPGSSTIAFKVFADGKETTIDPSKKLFIEERIGPPPPDTQTIRPSDLDLLVPDPAALTVFLAPNVFDSSSPTIGGTAYGGIGGKRCWFRTAPLSGIANSTTVPTHEIAHALGLPHIKASFNEAYLMHPKLQTNNIIIPSETLDDLII